MRRELTYFCANNQDDVNRGVLSRGIQKGDLLQLILREEPRGLGVTTYYEVWFWHDVEDYRK